MPTSPLTILVADDNAALRAMLVRVLTAAGCRVSQADGGHAAWAMANAGGFDVILLDVEMADRDGFQTAAAIRASGGPNAQTPILFVTGHDVDDIAGDPRGVGLIDGVLGKPLQAAELVRAVSGARRQAAPG